MGKRSRFWALALSVCVLLCSAAAWAAEGLLYNGDFSFVSQEQALPAGWYFDAWHMEDDGPSAYGMATQYGEPCVYLQNFGENDARICQRVAVEPNTAYRITCRAAASNVLGEQGVSLSVLDTFSDSDSIYHTDGFVTLVVTGVTGSDQTELVLALRLGGYGALATGSAWFRDVAMERLDSIPAGALSLAPMEPNGSSAGRQTALGPGFLGVVLAVLFCALLFFLYYRSLEQERFLRLEQPQSRTLAIAGFLAGGFLLRTVLSIVIVGHSTDMACFSYWAEAMSEGGPANFYSPDVFADYPPGYMYVLWLLGELRLLLQLPYGSAGALLLLKLPAILADLACACLLHRLALKRENGDGLALALLALYALQPAMAFLSGGWGQVDSILTLLLLLSMLLLTGQKLIWAGAVYGLAILLKPQALMAGPLLAVAYFCQIFDAPKEKRWNVALQTAGAVAAAVAVILLLALPFRGEQEPGWLLDMYFSTATSYGYASIEAFNMAALFGGNWADVSKVPFLFSYRVWGMMGIGISVLAASALYIKGRKKNGGALPLSMGFLFVSLFTLGHYMHERYIAPAILLLLCAFVYYRDKRLLMVSLWFSLTLLFNGGCAIYIVDHMELRGALYHSLTVIGSLMTVAGFFYLCYTAWDMVFRDHTKCIRPAKRPEPAALQQEGAASVEPARENSSMALLPEPADTGLHFTRRDRWYCLTLTAVYAMIALVNLGSLQAPETQWQGQKAGETVTVSFGDAYEVGQCWMFGGIGQGSLLISANGQDEGALTQTYDDMYRWAMREVAFTASSVTLTVYAGQPNLNEVAFFTPAGELIPIASVSPGGEAMFDEQDTLPERPSYYNGMYFDELYHGRTAYEHLHGIDPYENSHPPLGKVLIMLGIAVFGMNPFGWRIVGTLFGIGMVPILYCFGKRLFKKESYALLTAVLFAFDFMHFTQTRIATIDVYAVFFILLMYYYMYQYTIMNFYVDGLKSTLKPLALSGLFFALGAASKWIGIYAGLGLAVLLFYTLFCRWREYKKAEGKDRDITASFARNTIQTLLWCCVLFIAVPVVVYLLSYTPYYLCENRYGLKAVWDYQTYMWNYHSGLVATHPYQSSWWQWPLTLKPMWYYFGSYEAPGMYSSISASGNPAVWWVCSLGAVTAMAACVMKKIRVTPAVRMAIIGIGANFLPWVLVPRCTFIYHFFATVPFILLLTVALLRQAEEKRPEFNWIKWVWMGAAVLLFLLLYPGISGLPIPNWYAGIIKYLPGGGLLYGA